MSQIQMASYQYHAPQPPGDMVQMFKQVLDNYNDDLLRIPAGRGFGRMRSGLSFPAFCVNASEPPLISRGRLAYLHQAYLSVGVNATNSSDGSSTVVVQGAKLSPLEGPLQDVLMDTGAGDPRSHGWAPGERTSSARPSAAMGGGGDDGDGVCKKKGKHPHHHYRLVRRWGS